MPDLTPETLRKWVKFYRGQAKMARDMYRHVSECHATTADILDGLAELQERSASWLNDRDVDARTMWWVSLDGDLEWFGIDQFQPDDLHYPTPSAALIALAQQARERRGTDGN